MESEDSAPLIRIQNRSRGDSAATVVPAQQPPPDAQVPSYSDAIREGAGSQSQSPAPIARTSSDSEDSESDDSGGSYDSD